MQKLVGFDLEIAKEIDGFDWLNQSPLGISCVGVYGDFGYQVDHAPGKLSLEEVQMHVNRLMYLKNSGYTFVTVNGLGFDFRVLAEESQMWEECAMLALNHVDLMLLSVVRFGWRTGLDAFAQGARVQSKLKNVILNDGSVVEDMSGSMAPKLWAVGEYDAVLAYLRQDCETTYATAIVALVKNVLSWRSKAGKPYEVPLPYGYLPTVQELLTAPEPYQVYGRPPDTSWMTDPPSLQDIAQWALDVVGGY